MDKNLISARTQNAKLATKDELVATSYRPVGDSAKGLGTCPSNCIHLPENGGKCYTKSFLVNNQQRNSLKRNDDLDKLAEKGAKLVRLHTSGDFFSDGELDTAYLDEVIQWCKDHSDILVYTYTHGPKQFIEHGYTYKNNVFPDNLHITASCDTDEEKTFCTFFGFRTARVIDNESQKHEDETFCPYDLAKSRKVSIKTHCAKCTLCFNPKHKKNIAFMKQ